MSVTSATTQTKGFGRTVWLSVGFTALAAVIWAIGAVWVEREADAKALGFDHYMERLFAARAGFSDPTKYRDWETARRVAAEIDRRKREQSDREAKERKEIADRPQLACYAAQLAIKGRLADPSRAKFPTCSDWPGHIRADGANKWLVTSWVELPDQIGVIRQRGYQVSVTRDADGQNWRTFILTLP